MEGQCALGLLALLGVFFIAIGLLYLMRPDIQWAIQKWSMELFSEVRAEQGENWGCSARVVALTLIGMGLYALWLGADLSSKYPISEATRVAVMTDVKETRAAATAGATVHPDIRTLQAVFFPLMPTLQARAYAAPEAISRLSSAQRRRYGLEDQAVYYGVCGPHSQSYVIVENWGAARRTYHYGHPYAYPVSGLIGVSCGSYSGYSAPRWVEIAPESFDYETEAQKTATAESQASSITATPAG